MPTTLSTTPFIAWCTVLETASHIRSSVVGGGGGGFSYEGTGFSHVSPVETVHEKLREFWVRYDNGVEDRLDFRNIDVPAAATGWPYCSKTRASSPCATSRQDSAP